MVSFFSAPRRPVVACCSGLISKARSGVVLEDFSGASRPVSRARSASKWSGMRGVKCGGGDGENLN
jgi:hypothetical protein